MKRIYSISFILIISLLILTSFVSAIPKDFEVKEVHWAAKGTINDKPFKLGVMTLTWKDQEFFKHKKYDPESSLVYFDYDGEKYYSSALFSVVNDLSEEESHIPAGIFFYPLEDYGESSHQIGKYNLFLPIVKPGDLKLDQALISWVENVDWNEIQKLKKTRIDLDRYKEYLKQKAQWEIDHPMTYDPETGQGSGAYEGPAPEYERLREELFSVKIESQAGLEGLFTCNIGGVSHYYPDCQPSEDASDFDSRECRQQVDLSKGNVIIESSLSCYNHCFTNYYPEFQESNKQKKEFKSCRIYPLEIEKVTSNTINFETVPLLNPWRAGP